MEIDKPNISIVRTQVIKPNYLRLVIDELDITPQDGSGSKIIVRDYLRSREAVAVLIVCHNEDKVLLVRQYRHPVFVSTQNLDRAYIYEAVAGVIDDNESSQEAAIREIKEEVGFDFHPKIKRGRDGIRDIFYKQSIFTSPGISMERIHLFIATMDATEEPTASGLEQEGEKIYSEWLDNSTLKSMVYSGKIEDAKTLILLNHAGFI